MIASPRPHSGLFMVNPNGARCCNCSVTKGTAKVEAALEPIRFCEEEGVACAELRAALEGE
jgi:hypothetical protein